MRVHQSLAEIEEAFKEETVEERERRERRRRHAATRSRVRRSERVEKQGDLRFAGLVLAILLTTVVVTFVMFEMLALLTAP